MVVTSAAKPARRRSQYDHLRSSDDHRGLGARVRGPVQVHVCMRVPLRLRLSLPLPLRLRVPLRLVNRTGVQLFSQFH